MSDMIDRDAAIALPPYDGDGDPAGQFDHHIYVKLADLRALPAVEVGVKPLEWTQIGDLGWIATDHLFNAGVTALDPKEYDAERAARIRSALTVTPTPDAEKVQALYDPEGHWGDFIKSSLVEAEKAMRKFPQPNYVISKVAEEAGEVVKAAIHCAEGRETAENVRAEMRQLIAMLYRLWIEGDQVHGLLPVSAALAAMKEG